MNENSKSVKIKNNNGIENLIGFLLLMPIYMFITVLSSLLNWNNIINSIVIPVSMGLPIIIGMILSYKFYKSKINEFGSQCTCICILLVLATYYFYNSFFVEHTGWGGLGEIMLWLVTFVISRIWLFVFYGKIVGFKKTIIFFIIYIIFPIFVFLAG